MPVPGARHAEIIHDLIVEMACYAGMSVADLTRIQAAAQVLRDLAGQL